MSLVMDIFVFNSLHNLSYTLIPQTDYVMKVQNMCQIRGAQFLADEIIPPVMLSG